MIINPFKYSPPVQASDVETSNLAINLSFEGTSGAVVDSYNGLNGAVYGTVTRGVAGVVGNGFYFNVGKVVVPHNTILSLGGNKNFAASFWIDSSNFLSNNLVWIFHKRGGANEYEFFYTNGQLYFRIWNTDGTIFSLSSTVTIPSGRNQFAVWTDVENHTGGIVINRQSLSISVEGTIKTIQTSTVSLTIGVSPWNYDYPVIGMMDEFRIWTGATIPSINYLTNTEYNNGSGITL